MMRCLLLPIQVGIVFLNLMTLHVVLHVEPLVIIRQPSSFLQGNEIVKAKIGSPFSLECDVFGVPPPKYSWLLNGLTISGKHSSVLSYDSYE